MKILNSIKIKNIDFKNRIVMSPMVPFGLPPCRDGIMGDELLHHYLQRVSSGMGLMIYQSLSVTSKKMLDGGAGAYSDAHIPYLKKIVEACHSNGIKFFAQLTYPSIGYHNGVSIDQLTEDDMEEIKNEFVRAARLCKQAGCDGIELNGAHGFFLNMVTSPLSNKQGNQYGGDINGRLLLVKKIVEEVKAFANDDLELTFKRHRHWNVSG